VYLAEADNREKPRKRKIGAGRKARLQSIKEKLFWLFGLCYAMDGGYKGCNPYIERHLAIFVNCF
jgi:hypothetical protein